MKKLKLNQLQTKAELLNRDQLKKIMGGEVASGSGEGCAGWHEACNSEQLVYCCKGYICAGYKCYIVT